MIGCQERKNRKITPPKPELQFKRWTANRGEVDTNKNYRSAFYKLFRN
jgi:hypothetical protein